MRLTTIADVAMMTRGQGQGQVRLSSLCSAALVGFAALLVLTSAAPVVRDHVTADDTAVNQESDKPLVRAKRADEIIFDNVQNVAGSSSAAAAAGSSAPVKKSVDEEIGAKTDDVTDSAAKEQASSSAEESSAPTAAASDDSSSEASDDDQGQSAVASESTDGSDSVSWDADSDADKRRRRRSTESSEAAQQDKAVAAAGGRTKRDASSAMVAENMAFAGTGSSRLQRAKRDLDADEIIESRRPPSDYDGSDYGSPDAARQGYEEFLVPSDEQEEFDGEDGDYEDDEGDDEAEDDDDEMRYVGRPKRRLEDMTDEEREQEALEEAERQVVRELLAERAAEETRQALINYLTGHNDIERPQPPHRIVERYDDEFRNEGPDESYDEEDGDQDGAEEEDAEGEESYEEEPVEDQGELIEDGDGRFLIEQDGDVVEAVPDEAPSVAEQKRFSYPYSYEPFGGRWGAMVPGAKREDHDPYDRLYRLAEALSRPSSIGGGGSAADDEYKKK